MKRTFIITGNLSLKKTQYIFQLVWVYDCDDRNFSKESKKASKFNQVFDTQITVGLKKMQLTVIHGNPTVSRTKSQVIFRLGAAESEYMNHVTFMPLRPQNYLFIADKFWFTCRLKMSEACNIKMASPIKEKIASEKT